MARDRFIDPTTGETYSFHVNHDAEEDSGRSRNIDLSGVTGGARLVRQQGMEEPLMLRWTGTILHRDQFREMWRFFALCEYHSIHVKDFDDQEYEVQITSFQPVRKRGENRNDRSIPHHYWTYTLEMQVFTVISGDLLDMGIVD